MSIIFKLRRGKQSTMSGTKKTTVLQSGEVFLEYPNGGVGTGASKLKVGDGKTAYSSLPYALGEYADLLTPNSGFTVNKSTWRADITNGVVAWGEQFRNSNVNGGKDTGDITLWLAPSGTSQATLNMSIDGSVYINGNQNLGNGIKSITRNGSTYTCTAVNGSTSTFDQLTYPVYVKVIDGSYKSATRTQAFGSANAGGFITAVRNNTAGVDKSPQYGSGIISGEGDTHMYLYTSFSNSEFYVGGGNADKLNWVDRVYTTGYKPSASDVGAVALKSGSGLGSVSGSGKYNFCLIATLKVNANYVNRPISFEISGRGFPEVVRVSILFASINTADPGLSNFYCDCSWSNDWPGFYIKKSDTSTWQLYGKYNETWGDITVHRIYGCGINNNSVIVTLNMTNVDAVPAGYTTVSKIEDYGNEG